MWDILHIAFWTFAVLYFSWCLQIIARKTSVANDWLAWIPVVNLFYMVRMADRPYWWALLLFVPVVNLYALCNIWGVIAQKRNRPGWVGILMLIPVVNYMTLTNLAIRDEALVS